MALYPYLTEITIYPYNFAPRGYVFCGGGLLPISQYSAVFSLIGTTYGGNGTTNFAVPNLLGRAPVSNGRGPGLSAYDQGEMVGTATVTLTESEVPAHTHMFRAVLESQYSDVVNPQSTLNRSRLDDLNGFRLYASNGTPDSPLSSQAVSTVGGQPHNNRQPMLAVNFCMAVQGIYPSRN